jgi:hypothetical protein
MTKHPCLLARTLLALLVLSACSPRASNEGASTEVAGGPRSSAGITTFGDARIGVAF